MGMTPPQRLIFALLVCGFIRVHIIGLSSLLTEMDNRVMKIGGKCQGTLLYSGVLNTPVFRDGAINSGLVNAPIQ
jgi:hypothetical protein